jgi:predicted Zn-dependent peptidase
VTRLPRPLAALAAAAALLGPSAAAPPAAHAQRAPAAAPAGAPRAPAPIRLEQYALPNGLTVVLAPDRSTQVVAVDVWYDVGARDERPGRTGFAHLFEHMMFQGSANVKKGEHFQLVERAGGQMNGSTAADRTNYFEALPSNRLNLGLWLEADRMRSLAVTAENLKNQQEAVKEEKRLRQDNQPYVGSFLQAIAGSYDSTRCFAYGHELIGSMADLEAASVADVRAFFKTYYAPNNAALVVAGDFDPAEARRLVAQYFGDIPRAAPPPPVRCDQPFNTGQQRKAVTDAKATLPAVLAVYRIPEYRSPDLPALTLLSSVLGRGESSRLNRAVAREARAAVAVQAVLNPLGPTRGPGLFGVLGIANQGVAPDSLERLLAAEVARVAREGVTEAELAKAKNGYLAERIDALQSNLARAEAIHTARLFLGSAEAVNTDLQRYAAVTAADVRRVAQTYLVPANSVVTLISPPAAPGAAPAAAPGAAQAPQP